MDNPKPGRKPPRRNKMRTEAEIKARIEELENTQKIANYQLKKSIYEQNKSEEIYWEKTAIAFESQIYGMKFSIGECE
jgi:hypothetical protein